MNRKPSIFEWIKRELKPRSCNSEEFIYEDMASQSGCSLPILYQPFDAGKKSHWRDRGSLFDYLYSTGGRKLLDFGPGDGWPSLMVAPFVDKVVGVEGSRRRVEVCAENAERLGILNTEFVFVEPESSLPFPDNSFDGVMAASSVEQTPDPKATLHELFRVLRPGGCLRIGYEALGRYQNGRERETWLCQLNDHTCRLILYDRQIDDERAKQYGITLAMSRREAINSLSKDGGSVSFDTISIPLLERVRSAVVDARVCSLAHPSGRTLVSWLRDVGFSEVQPSHSGGEFAGWLFDQIPEERRPKNIDSLDALLKPLVRIVVQMVAPLDLDPMITAIK